jgi:hypothetical protein
MEMWYVFDSYDNAADSMESDCRSRLLQSLVVHQGQVIVMRYTAKSGRENRLFLNNTCNYNQPMTRLSSPKELIIPYMLINILFSLIGLKSVFLLSLVVNFRSNLLKISCTKKFTLRNHCHTTIKRQPHDINLSYHMRPTFICSVIYFT